MATMTVDWISEMEWAKDAACHGKGFAPFFAQSKEDEGKAICQGCPVLSECLEFALPITTLEGVWGGMSEIERYRERQRRHRARRRANA